MEAILDTIFDYARAVQHPAIRSEEDRRLFVEITKSRSGKTFSPVKAVPIKHVQKEVQLPLHWADIQATRQNFNSVYFTKTPIERWSHYIVNKSIYKKDPYLFYLDYLEPFERDGYIPLLEPYYNIFKLLKIKAKHLLRKSNERMLRSMRRDKTVNYLSKTTNIFSLLSEEIFSSSNHVYNTKPIIKHISKSKRSIKSKKYIVDMPKVDYCVHNPYYINYLKNKIRIKIESMRSSKYNYIKLLDVNSGNVHQMDIPEHGNEGGNKDKAGNVVIEQEAAVVSAVQSKPCVNWLNFVTSDTITQAQNMTDRWIEVKSFDWTINSAQNTPLLMMNLPKDLINDMSTDLKPCDTPNFALFNLHAYSVVDITVKLLINSSKFQTGCLQMSWIYQANNDHNSGTRENIYTLSQTSHVRAYAGSQNECELHIPFKYSLSMLYNQKSPRVANPLDMGNLYVFIVNPLIVGTSVTNIAHCVVQVKFSNARFTGMRAGNIPSSVEHQMLPAAGLVTTMAAMRLLDTYLPDPNRDNPPLNAEASYVVPTASHSWCAGTGRVDVSKILRLDTRGQTHHPVGVQPEEPFTVDFIKRKQGLLSQYSIEASRTNRATQIFNIAVEPMFGKISRNTTLAYEIAKAYNLPPISVISSLFCYWRGEIDFEIDIVASQFHTFKLLFAYIPNAPDTGVTFAMAQKSPHIIISCEGPKNVTLRIPYVANQRWWPRTYTGNYELVSAKAPSRFYCFLNNAIVRQNSAADKVYMNIYVCGAPSFEVSVPVQPSLGIGTNVYYFPSDSYMLAAKPDLSKCTDVNIRLEVDANNKKVPRVVVKFVDKNKISQQERLYYKIRPEFSYKKHEKTLENRLLYIVEIRDRYVQWLFECKESSTSAAIRKELIYGTLYNDASSGNAIFIPCINRKSAFTVSDYIQTFNYSISNLSALESHLFTYKIGETDDKLYFNAIWVGGTAICDLAIISGVYNEEVTGSVSDFVVVQNGEREPKTSGMVLNMGTTVSQTNFGHLDFGESFNDLYNLCRRPQLYGSIKLSKNILTNTDKCAFIFTVNPQGLGEVALRDSTDPEQVLNRCRDGPIPLLLSAFRYFRGSLRFRLVFPSCNNTLVWVQHRPDRPSRPLMLSSCNKIDTAQAVFNHGYASELQLCNINSTVQFEVPYYQYDHYGLLQSPEDQGLAFDYQYGLGQICVGIKASPQDLLNFEDKYCEIYYSLADDFSPSLFYGFPQMIFLDDLPAVEHQMGLWDSVKSKVKGELTESVKEEWEEHRETLKEEVNHLADELIAEKLSQFKKCLEDGMMGAGTEVDTHHARNLTILNILSNLLHTAANFNARSVAISVVSLFVNLGLFTASKLEKVYAIVTNIFERFGATQQTENHNQHQGPTDSSEEKEEVASWVSLIFGGICSLFSVSQATAAPEGKKFETFTKHFTFGMRGSNAVFQFVKNSFLAVKKIFKYLLYKLNPEYRNLKKLNTDKDVLNAWIKEVLYLTDPGTIDKMYTDKFFVDRVHAAVDYGGIFIVNCLEAKLEQKYINTINKLYTKLVEIKGQLTAMGEDPHIRREPFGIYMAGSPGVGKSSVRESICLELLKSVNYSFDSPDIFCVVNASSKHWDQCRKQPVLVLDDLWNIQTGELLYEQINMLFQIFSSVVLCPPKAAVEDKTMRYNPRIVWMNSNYEYLRVEGADMSAVNRRRNVLLVATSWYPSCKEFSKVGCPHCKFGLEVYNKADPGTRDADLIYDLSKVPAAYLSDYHHMRFFVCKDKIVDNHALREGPYTYEEVLTYLKNEFIQFDQNETAKFNARVARYQDLCSLNNYSLDDEDIDSSFSTIYFRHIEQLTKFNQEELERYKRTWVFEAKSLITSATDKIHLLTSYLNTKINSYKCEPKIDDIPFVNKAKKNVEETEKRRVSEINGRKCYTVDELIARGGFKSKSTNPFEDNDVPWDPCVSSFNPFGDDWNLTEHQAPNWSNINNRAKLNNSGKVFCTREGIDFYSEEAYRSYKSELAHANLMKEKDEEWCPEGFYKPDKGLFHTDGTWLSDVVGVKTQTEFGQNSIDIPAVISKFLSKTEPELRELYKNYSSYSVLDKFGINYSLCLKGRIFGYKANGIFIFRLKSAMHVGCVLPTDTWFRSFNNIVEKHYLYWKHYGNRFEDVFELVLLHTEKDEICPHAGKHPRDLVCIDKILYDGVKRDKINMGKACDSHLCPFNSTYYTYMFYRAWLSTSFIYRQAYKNKKLDILPEYFTPDNEFRDYVLNDLIDKIAYYWNSIWESRLGKAALFCFKLVRWLIPVVAFTYIGTKVSNFVRAKVEVPPANSWGDPQNTYDPTSRASNMTTNKGPSGNAFFQGCQQAHHIVNTVNRNMFYIVVLDVSNNNERLFRCIGLGQRAAIGLKHYFECIDYLFVSEPLRYKLYFRYCNDKGHMIPDGQILLNYNDLKRKIKYSHRSLDSDNITNTNLCVFELPLTVPYFRDLTKFIAYEKDLKHAGSEGMFADGSGKDIYMRLSLKEIKLTHGLEPTVSEKKKALNTPAIDTPSTKANATRLYSWWQYGLQQQGFCGSIILSTNLEKPIVGIHVAGNPKINYGFAEPIFREMFENVPYIKSLVKDVIPLNCNENDVIGVELQGPLVIYGTVKQELAQRQPYKTSIKKSVIHGNFPVNTQPNPLRKGEPPLPEYCDPLAEGVNKHGHFVDDFDDDLLDRAYNDLKYKLLNTVIPVKAEVNVLDEETVICGNANVPEMDALAWDTSAGFPLSSKKPVNEKGKKWLFDLTETPQGYTLNKLHPYLQQQLNDDRNLRSQHIPVPTVFSDCLKDTCIAKEKCSIPGKTRIFSVSPVQYTIEYKRYFLNFMAAYRRNRIISEHAIGINCDSMEWTKLVHYITEVGDNIVVGDYSNFGPGLNLKVALKASEIMVDWNEFHDFTPEQLNICRLLNLELIDRYHLCNNIIYKPPAGSPSGGPSTDIINSLVNCLYIRMAWISLTKLDLGFFHEHVRLVVYGDDLIMSVSDKYINVFNGLTLSNWFAKYKIKFTDALKTGELVAFRDLYTSTFLKRNFVPHPIYSGCFLAPVDIESIHGCLNWVKGTLPNPVATEENLRAAMELLYGHGPRVYKQYLIKLIKLAIDYNLKFDVRDWVEIDTRNFSELYN